MMKVRFAYNYLLDKESESEDDAPELKPNVKSKPNNLDAITVSNDIIKCSQIYQKLCMPKEAEKMLLSGLD